jgi:hypothetical protein
MRSYKSEGDPGAGSPTNDLYSLGWRSLAVGDRVDCEPLPHLPPATRSSDPRCITIPTLAGRICFAREEIAHGRCRIEVCRC